MKKSELQKRLEDVEKELAEAKALLAKVETNSRVVDSVKDIPNRKWYIDSTGEVVDSDSDDLNQMSTEERAEAMLALIQLIEIHAVIEQELNADYYTLIVSSCKNKYIYFYFESEELGDEFESKHKDLIETVRKGL
jgi:hypothetical protein